MSSSSLRGPWKFAASAGPVPCKPIILRSLWLLPPFWILANTTLAVTSYGTNCYEWKNREWDGTCRQIAPSLTQPPRNTASPSSRSIAWVLVVASLEIVSTGSVTSVTSVTVNVGNCVSMTWWANLKKNHVCVFSILPCVIPSFLHS